MTWTKKSPKHTTQHNAKRNIYNTNENADYYGNTTVITSPLVLMVTVFWSPHVRDRQTDAHTDTQTEKEGDTECVCLCVYV